MLMKMLHQTRSCRLDTLRLACFIFGLVWPVLVVEAQSAAAGNDEDFFTHLHTEKAMANVTVSPGHAGPVEITIQLETADELPLTAKAVSVTLSNAQSGIGLQTMQAKHTSDDQWYVRTSALAPGRWTLGLDISISGTDQVTVESPILIK
jgi:copper transport protein